MLLMQSFGKIGVVSVLDGIISSALHFLGNIAPAIAMLDVHLDDLDIFLPGPLLLGNVWVQVVVPSLSALLANSAWQALGNVSPIVSTIADDDLGQNPVLFLGPATLGKMLAIVKFEPTCVTLDLGLALELLADSVPRVLTILLDVAQQ